MKKTTKKILKELRGSLFNVIGYGIGLGLGIFMLLVFRSFLLEGGIILYEQNDYITWLEISVVLFAIMFFGYKMIKKVYNTGRI